MIDSFLNFFTFKRFALGSIVIFLAPLINIVPLIFIGESTTAKCVYASSGYSNSWGKYQLEYNVGDYKYTALAKGIYESGEEVILIYNKENPFEFVDLSFSGIYFNVLSFACILFFTLWFIGYYASLDKAILSATLIEKIYDLLIKVILAAGIIVIGGIVFVLPFFIYAQDGAEALVGWFVLVMGMVITAIAVYKTSPQVAEKVNLFFSKKTKQSYVKLVNHDKGNFNYNKPKEKSFLQNLFHSDPDNEFKLFTTKRFIIGIIILCFAPAIASLSAFVNAQKTEGTCIRTHFGFQSNKKTAVVQFLDAGTNQKYEFTDDVNSLEEGDTIPLLYLPEQPDKILVLTFFGLYDTIWTGICIGLLLIWAAGYYASLE